MYEKIEVTIRGIAPLLMHNGQLADPLNEHTKAIKKVSSRRKKTDEDYIELARLEFLGGLYLDESGKIVIPARNLEACVLDGAKRSRRGKEFSAGCFVENDAPLMYDGPKTADGLWCDKNFRNTIGVRVSTARIMRTRPIFKKWSCKFEIQYIPDMINGEDIKTSIRDAGLYAGLGDYTPRFGRFVVEK